MDNNSPNVLVSIFRGCRFVLHIVYGVLLAIFYPHFNQARRRIILRMWSLQLLNILNIGIRTEGHWPVRGEGGYLIVANHVSWLDVFVLNTIYPSRFIAKAEVRDWPLVGWLSKRSNTIFIERGMRQDAASANWRAGELLKQGICVGLFPEGDTTDGKQVGHFHSALFQSAIDVGAMLCPIALCYQNQSGQPDEAVVFTGNTTIAQSIWRILRCRHLDALLVFTPALATAGENRRILARAAREAIVQGLQNIADMRQEISYAVPRALLSAQSSYAFLILPLPGQPRK